MPSTSIKHKGRGGKGPVTSALRFGQGLVMGAAGAADQVVGRVVGFNNPAVSPEQYRLAQAVLSGTAKETGMSKKVARELVDKTPAKLRSEWSRRTNPTQAVVQPSKRKKGYFDLFIGGIHRITKPTLRGAIGYAKQIEKSSGGPMELVIHDESGNRVNPSSSLWSKITHLGQQTTVRHVPSGAVYSQVGTAKGYKIYRDGRLPAGQQFVVPGLDRESRFESLKEAKRFIASNPKIKRHRNPADTAAEMYESFHGEASDEVLEFDEAEHYHSNLAALGSLIGLKIRTVTGFDMTVEFSDVTLCSNEDGTQLYLVGGDQSLDLSKVKLINEKKDSLVIGELWCVGYHTEKDFDKFQPTDYIHCLGEEKDYRKLPKNADLWEDAEPPKDDVFGTGTLPTVRYDTLNERIFLDGGTYFINKPLVGTSPGIEG